MNKLYCALFLALIALSTTRAQMEEEDDEFQGASDGDGDGNSSEESQEVASSDDFSDGRGSDDDRFGGETRQNDRGFTTDEPFGPQFRGMKKRSLTTDNIMDSLVRVRRGYKHHGVVGPVFTHVKTDHDGNFKWGVKHKVGGGHHHGHY